MVWGSEAVSQLQNLEYLIKRAPQKTAKAVCYYQSVVYEILHFTGTALNHGHNKDNKLTVNIHLMIVYGKVCKLAFNYSGFWETSDKTCNTFG